MQSKIQLLLLKGLQDRDIEKQVITPSVIRLSNKKQNNFKEHGDLIKIKGFITDFSNIEVNKFINYDSEWVSTGIPYVITTNTQVCHVGHYAVENKTSTIINTKYCILDNGSCEYSTDNKLIIAAEGTLTVNGELHERGVFSDLNGSVTISSEARSYVFLIEYTE